MEQVELDYALARMEAALARVERAAMQHSDLAERHARLREAVSATVREIDDLLGDMQR